MRGESFAARRLSLSIDGRGVHPLQESRTAPPRAPRRGGHADSALRLSAVYFSDRRSVGDRYDVDGHIGLSAQQVAGLIIVAPSHLNLRRTLEEQRSVQSIAAAIGLSLYHAHRLLNEEAETVMKWVWRQRLEACRRDLADARQSTLSISAIAFRWGFNNCSHFPRAFRARYGMSPREGCLQANGSLPG